MSKIGPVLSAFSRLADNFFFRLVRVGVRELVLKKLYWLIAALYLALYILPLGLRPLMIPDETRYAEIPREMIASGDWVSPRLDGIRYFEKPPMGYWLNALSQLTFGANPFGVRFPSALAAGITALMLFLLARRFIGRDSSALLCAGMLLTSVEVFALGVFNVLDGPLAMFLTMAMTSFFFAYQEKQNRKKRVFLILFGLFCGLAFLTKGFLALVLPGIIVIPFMIWERRLKELGRIVWIPLTVLLLTVLPWALLIQQREPDFWRYFIWVEHIQRFISNSPQHQKPFWYFIPVLFIGALPWSVLLPAGLKGIIRQNFKEPLFRFACCWFLFPFLFFSAAQGKLPTYILPCFPPLMIIVCIGLRQYFEARRRRLFLIPAWTLAAGAILFALSIVGSQAVDLFGIKMFGPAETWKGIMLTAAFLIGGLFLLLVRQRSDYQSAMGAFSLAPILFLMSSHFCLPDQIKEHKAPTAFLLEQASKLGADSILMADEKLLSAVCWTYKRNDVYLVDEIGEFAYGLQYKDSKRSFLTFGQFAEHIRTDEGNGRTILIADESFFKKNKSSLLKTGFEERSGDFIFIQY